MARICDRCESRDLVELRYVSINKAGTFGMGLTVWSKALDLCSKCSTHIKNAIEQLLAVKPEDDSASQ